MSNVRLHNLLPRVLATRERTGTTNKKLKGDTLFAPLCGFGERDRVSDECKAIPLPLRAADLLCLIHTKRTHVKITFPNQLSVPSLAVHWVDIQCATKKIKDLTLKKLRGTKIVKVSHLANLYDALANGVFPNLQRLHAYGIALNPSDGLLVAKFIQRSCYKNKLENLSLLSLRENHIDNEGMKAIASAGVSGALASLRVLDLAWNSISDAGIPAFSSALGSGALPRLERLLLDSNSIGDAGMSAFASACANGALPSLQVLDLDDNKISDTGMTTFADALSKGALSSLKTLHMDGNAIGNAGMTAFAGAVSSGALPKLNILFIDSPSAELTALCSSKSITLNTFRSEHFYKEWCGEA